LFLARRPAKCHPPASGDALEEGTGIEDPPGGSGPGSIGAPAAKLPGDDPEGEKKPAPPPGRPSVSRESVRSGEEEDLSAKIAKGSDGEEENAAAALDSGPELEATRSSRSTTRSSRSTPSATAATGERREAGPANASGRASGAGEPGPASARGPGPEAEA
jgi:hypothetical protein